MTQALFSSLSVPFRPVLAAGPALPFLGEIVALLAVSVGIAYLCYRVHIVPIAGFLIAGVVIGPHALGLVEDMELVTQLAEIGVILLLFTIGVEFSLEKLARIKRLVLGGGALQVGLTIGAVTGLCLAFGVDWRNAVYTGTLVSLSSTAIVLGLLTERGETDSPSGQNALGILIFQDLAIIVMVLLMPLLGGQGGSTLELLQALGAAVLLIAVVLVLAYYVVPWILERVAKTRRSELFLLAVVAICFGTAWITSLADVSLALGAFLAGLVVSESEYSTQALSEILPLRTVFNAAFFVSVGMLLDLSVVFDQPLLILGAAAAALAIKLVVTSASVLALRYPVRIAVAAGLTLAQIGEFSFVLNVAGSEAGLTPAGLGALGEQVFIAATVLLMLLTPLLVQAAPEAGGMADRLRERVGAPDAGTPDVDADVGGHGVDLEDHVVIVGYGPAGRRLTAVLQQTDIPFVIIDLNPRSIEEAREDGLAAIYGDATRPHVMEVAGLDRAKTLVVAINDRRATRETVQRATMANPTLQVVARADFLDDVAPLHEVGAETVVSGELETAVRLFAEVLRIYRVPGDEIQEHVREVRADDYGLMRAPLDGPHAMTLDGLDEEGLHTRTVTVRADSRAAGQTLDDLHLERDHGLAVLALRRDGHTITDLDGGHQLEAGDQLVLLGSADCFVSCAEAFRPPSSAAREPSPADVSEPETS
jgi:CPA2 family monovalent cation:H+ antiporter-2